jgi:hypothetical protein
MFEKLDTEILGKKKFISEKVLRGNPTGIAEQIYSHNVTVVVFIGYWSDFEPILNSLNEKYNNDKKKLRPKIVLSDGCLDSSLQSIGFDLFVSFPSPTANEQTFEMFGYDSMKIMGQAIQRINDKGLAISRLNITKELQSKDRKFSGARFEYRFINGESSNLDYYILDVANKKVEKIPSESLQTFRQDFQKNK